LLPSSTLLALGMDAREAYGGVRLSYGRFSTRDDIDTFLEAFASLLS
jgi:cysteine sulfinate desulfinase/cysteine desulfurase-like protein